MNVFHFVLIAFGGAIIALGVMLARKILSYRSMPDEETRTEQTDLQTLLQKRLEQNENQQEENSSQE